MSVQKTIAREWLTFICSLVFGFITLPVWCLFFGEDIWELYRALGDDNDWPFAVFFACIPYLAFQFVRSIIWAIKALRSKKKHR